MISLFDRLLLAMGHNLHIPTYSLKHPSSSPLPSFPQTLPRCVLNPHGRAGRHRAAALSVGGLALEKEAHHIGCPVSAFGLESRHVSVSVGTTVTTKVGSKAQLELSELCHTQRNTNMCEIGAVGPLPFNTGHGEGC